MTAIKDLTCEIRLLDPGRLCLEIDGLMIEGRCTVDERLSDDVRQATDSRKAGALLFDALLPEGQPTLDAYRKISTEFRHMGARQSIRLHIDDKQPEWVHQLPWELLFDPRRRVGLGNSHDISFLRTVDTSHPPLPPIEGRMRLLVAVSAPNDVLHHNLPALDRRFEERTLVSALRRLQDLVHCEVLEAPVTADRLKQRLADGTFHTLHLVTHGRKLPHESRARILLEDPTGRGVWTDEQDLAKILGADPELHLITLVACHDGIETRADPFQGLGPALVSQGTPAVVVTRRALTVSQAAKVTTHLYRGLALSGRIDEAINEARERLFHSRPERFTWAAPTAFLGGDPFLWHSEEARRQQVEEDTQSLEIAQFRQEQQQREQLAAWVEPPPPPRKVDPRWRLAASVLAVVVVALGLGLAGVQGFGPLAPWLVDDPAVTASDEPPDLRPRKSIDPEATRRAIPRYASACDSGQTLACSRLATIYELGRGVQRDLTAAKTYYEQACSGGDPSSCYHLGHLLESPSKGEAADIAEVLGLYHQACQGGELRACRRLTVRKAQDNVPLDRLTQAADLADPGGPADHSELPPGVVPASGRPLADSSAQLADSSTAASGTRLAGLESQAQASEGQASEAQSPEAQPPESSDSGGSASGTDSDDRESLAKGSSLLAEGPPTKGVVDGRLTATPKGNIPPLADRSGNGTQWIYEVGGTSETGTLVGQARGNVYRIFQPAELLEWDVKLDFIDQQDLTFSVHVADAAQGSFTSIFNRSITVQGRGSDWYSSGELSLSLEADRYYLIAVSWNGEVTYSYGSGPQETLFAELTHGHADFDPILPDVESEVLDLAAYRQRLITAHSVVVDGHAVETQPESLVDALARDLAPANVSGDRKAPYLEIGNVDFTSLESSQFDDGGSGAGARGNLVRLSQDVAIHRVSIWLDLQTTTQLQITMLRSQDRGGPFRSIHRVSWTPTVPGAAWYPSPTIDLELAAGAYYAVIASWDTEAGYRYGVGGLQELPDGTVLRGIAGSQSSSLVSLAGSTVDRAIYQQRWHLSPEPDEPNQSSAQSGEGSSDDEQSAVRLED